MMRGSDEQTGSLFSYVSCEARVPADHPLRLIRAVVDEALDEPQIVPAQAGCRWRRPAVHAVRYTVARHCVRPQRRAELARAEAQQRDAP